MPALTLRTRIALWTAVLVIVVLTVFGVASAYHLYHEQLEAFEKEVKVTTAQPAFDYKREAEEIVGHLMRAYILALPLVVTIVAVGSWWIATHALKPIRNITQTAEHIHAAALSKRLPPSGTQDDVAHLIDVLNGMFDRLERSFAQATRFSADASHELRTPLAILRGQIEDALKEHSGDPRLQPLFENLLDQTLRLGGITSKLLLLSKADAGQLHIEKVPVDLTTLCHDLVEDVKILAIPRSISVTPLLQSDLFTEGDEELLRQALLNLLDNAVKYNHTQGAVHVTLREDEKNIVIDIGNTGPRIPEEKVPRLFQRFFRVDASRSQASGGAGLGLSLAREIFLAHGGDIHLVQSDDTETLFRVILKRFFQTGLSS